MGETIKAETNLCRHRAGRLVRRFGRCRVRMSGGLVGGGARARIEGRPFGFVIGVNHVTTGHHLRKELPAQRRRRAAPTVAAAADRLDVQGLRVVAMVITEGLLATIGTGPRIGALEQAIANGRSHLGDRPLLRYQPHRGAGAAKPVTRAVKSIDIAMGAQRLEAPKSFRLQLRVFAKGAATTKPVEKAFRAAAVAIPDLKIEAHLFSLLRELRPNILPVVRPEIASGHFPLRCLFDSGAELGLETAAKADCFAKVVLGGARSQTEVRSVFGSERI